MKKPFMSSMFTFMLGIYALLSCADAFIGINWGRLSSQRLIPSMVVDLLLQNGIKNVRIFQQADNVLGAFTDTNIKVTFGLPNSLLGVYLGNQTAAGEFLKKRIIPYEGKVEIGYLTIGNHPFSQTSMTGPYDVVVDVLRYMQGYLNDNNRSHIKATIPHFTDVLNLKPGMPPSEADFREGIKAKMTENVDILKRNNSPFMLSMFPIDYVTMNKQVMPFEFAFIDNKSKYNVTDGKFVYTNAFEYLYDACHYALEKSNGTGVKIVISAIGWPTDATDGANVANAERFYKSLLPYIASGRGTPARPNTTIDVYLNNLSDENRMLLELGAYQRHWGIYKFNGEPKYKIDFSGKGRDIWPSKAEGIISMPSRWCVFTSGITEDRKKVQALRDSACNKSDCSSLEPGGSCAHLDEDQQTSYAFNRYFQTQSQSSDDASGDACNMGGLGRLVAEDPSNGTCVFPVEILSAEDMTDGTMFAGGDDDVDKGRPDIGRGDRVQWQTSASAVILGSTVFWMII